MSVFKDDCLADEVLLITGGGSGIGFGISKALADHGAKVVLMGRREDVLKDAQKNIGTERCHYVAGDVRVGKDCVAAVEETVKKFGKLSILINAAAGNFLCPPEQLSENAFKTVMDIDACGTFNMCKASFESLKNAKTSVILNISATLHYAGTYFQAHVAAAKAAVDALTLNLAHEWGEHGIRVVGIAPGAIGDTEGMRRLAPGEAMLKIEKTIPLRRMGKISDIGDVSVFLSSKAASYITGEILVVDGGQWFSRPPMVPRALVEKMLAMRT